MFQHHLPHDVREDDVMMMLSATCAMTRQPTIMNSYSCSICLLARSPTKKFEAPTGNTKKFRIPNKVGDEKNRPYKLIYYDFKGTFELIMTEKSKKLRKKTSDVKMMLR